MATLPELEIAIGADITEIKRAINSVSTDLKKLKQAAEKPAPGASALFGIDLDKARNGISGLASQLKAAAAAYASFAGLGTLARIADEANTLQARLKLATQNQEQFNIAQQATFEIAQNTRTSLNSTITLYSRLERSTRELGVNQATLLKLTETINQAAQISGGGPEAEAALLQLSQGLAAGTLRGEELNSVLEQAPRIAQAIADGMGVPIGALKKLAEQGKITSEQVAQALLGQAPKIAGEYAQLPLTIGGAFTQLSNAFTVFIRDADDASGASAQIAGAISDVAKRLPEIISALIGAAKAWAAYALAFKFIPGIIGAVIVAQERWKASALALSQASGAASKSVRLLGVAFRGLQASLVVFTLIYEAFKFLRKNFKEVEIAGIYFVRSAVLVFLKLQESAQKVAAYVPALFEDMWTGIKNFAADALDFIGKALDAVPGRLGRALQSTADAAKTSAASLRTATSDGSALEQKLADITEQAAKTREEFIKINDEQLADAYSGSINDREKRDEKARQAALQKELDKQKIGVEGQAGKADGGKFNARLKAVADENDLILDNIDRALSDLEARYDDNLISVNEYYSARSALQTAAVEQELTAKRQELSALQEESNQLKAAGKDNTSNIEAQSRILTDIIKLERDKARIGTTGAREQAQAERELADELAGVRQRLAEATGQTAETRRQQIEAEFTELLTRLRAKGDTEGIALVNKLINVESAKANLDEIEESVGETLGNLRATEDNISAQIEAGLLGQFRGEEQLQQAREKSIEQLQRYKQELQAAYEAARDPQIQAEIQKRIQALDTEIARVTASTQELQNKLKDIGQSGLKQFFTDIISGTKSIGDAFRALILDIAQRIGELAAENVAGAIVGKLGGGGGGGGGDLLSKAFDFIGSFFHKGGIVGQGAPIQRALPAWVWAGAPRFHSGGMAGLKPDEVPAILQTGEEVLSRNDPRNAANAGQSPGFRVVNVLDPRMAGDYLESSEGERVIMNVIGRNPGQVRQLLG